MSEGIKLRDANCDGQSFHIGDPKHRFAPGIVRCLMRDCDIVLQGRSSLTLIDSQFHGCRVSGRRAYQYFLNSADWIGCTFSGRFTDCVFGRHHDREEPNVVKDCDFSQAVLNVVSFRGGLDYDSCVWPGWPTVVFRKTEASLAVFRELALPPPLKGLLCLRLLEPEQYFATDLSEMDEPPEDVLSVLFDCPDVLIADRDTLERPSAAATEQCIARFERQLTRKEAFAWWGHVSQLVSLTGIESSQNHVDIHLVQGKTLVLNAPERFVARLSGNHNVELIQEKVAVSLSEFPKTFRLMGSKCASDFESVELKGHRKKLGVLRLTYDTLEFLDELGEVIPKPDSVRRAELDEL